MDNNIVKQYESYINSFNLSTNTIEAYMRDLKKFLLFLDGRNTNIYEADNITIMEYVQYLQKSGHANSSIIRSTAAIRKFYKFLINKKIINENPMFNYEVPRHKQRNPEVLTIEEIERLLAVPDIETFKGIRDRAMLETMYAAGLKIGELLSLKLDDINLKLRYIKCKGNNNRERIIPIGSYAAKYIEDYLVSRKKLVNLDTCFIFVNNQGNQMTRQGFWKIIKYYAEKADIKKSITPYTIRHSFAVHLLQNDIDLKSVQEFLGYSTLYAVQTYFEMCKKSKLSEAYKRAHPRA